jgi:hypothetical protein
MSLACSLVSAFADMIWIHLNYHLLREIACRRGELRQVFIFWHIEHTVYKVLYISFKTLSNLQISWFCLELSKQQTVILMNWCAAHSSNECKNEVTHYLPIAAGTCSTAISGVSIQLILATNIPFQQKIWSCCWIITFFRPKPSKSPANGQVSSLLTKAHKIPRKVLQEPVESPSGKVKLLNLFGHITLTVFVVNEGQRRS